MPSITVLGKVSSTSRCRYTSKADPVCACGGRHQPHECSVHAPTEPPEHDAPDHEWFAHRDGGYTWWPPSPNNVKVFRGKPTMPPMASFNWRRMCHALLWNYTNTETVRMYDITPLKPRRARNQDIPKLVTPSTTNLVAQDRFCLVWHTSHAFSDTCLPL